MVPISFENAPTPGVPRVIETFAVVAARGAGGGGRLSADLALEGVLAGFGLTFTFLDERKRCRFGRRVSWIGFGRWESPIGQRVDHLQIISGADVVNFCRLHYPLFRIPLDTSQAASKNRKRGKNV